MSNAFCLETSRLRLRPWRESDRASFAALTADSMVMKDQGGALGRTESDRKFDQYAAAYEINGYGRWLIETKGGEFIGYCGVMPVGNPHPLGPHNEIGWRLVHEAWGKGYATEAARGALLDALERVRLQEVVAYTSPNNLRSQAVMQRLALRRDVSRDFAGKSSARMVWIADERWRSALFKI